MDGWMNRRIGGWMDERMDGWIDRWMDGSMDEWMDRSRSRLVPMNGVSSKIIYRCLLASRATR